MFSINCVFSYKYKFSFIGLLILDMIVDHEEYSVESK